MVTYFEYADPSEYTVSLKTPPKTVVWVCVTGNNHPQPPD